MTAAVKMIARSWSMRRLAGATLAAALLPAPFSLASPEPAAAPFAGRPIVIAHRGASGYLPEETLAAYRLALRMGADFIEPDVFLTSDGVPVARHDRALNVTTDVEQVAAADPDLAAKRSSSGAFEVDRLTHADLRKLRARSRGSRGYSTPGNGHYSASDTFPLATLREVLDLAYEAFRATGRVVGVYPEVKAIGGEEAPEYHRRSADAILAMLADPKYHGYFDGSRGNVYLQSFDRDVVRYLKSATRLPVVFLTPCPPTPEAAAEIKAFADGVGISRASSASNAACVERAKAAGLLVHAYTLHDDPATYEQVFG